MCVTGLRPNEVTFFVHNSQYPKIKYPNVFNQIQLFPCIQRAIYSLICPLFFPLYRQQKHLAILLCMLTSLAALIILLHPIGLEIAFYI